MFYDARSAKHRLDVEFTDQVSSMLGEVSDEGGLDRGLESAINTPLPHVCDDLEAVSNHAARVHLAGLREGNPTPINQSVTVE